MAGKLTGKVAIITGASAGIGWASAIALAEEGAHIVITARREDRLKQLVEAIRKAGGDATLVAGDAIEEDTAKRTVEAALKVTGKIDILLNNAGMGIYKQLADTPLENYDTMMDTNMRSGFLFTRYVVPEMLKQ